MEEHLLINVMAKIVTKHHKYSLIFYFLDLICIGYKAGKYSKQMNINLF